MLTAKQTKFVNEVSEGSSQSSAYRKAYDTSRMTPKTVWEESSRLRKHPKVSARIVELEAEKEARQRVQALSREDRILNELEDIAFGSTNAMARLRALELLGKTVGLFKPKEVREQTRTADEIKSAIELKLAALIE
jgi:hypothetical protein